LPVEEISDRVCIEQDPKFCTLLKKYKQNKKSLRKPAKWKCRMEALKAAAVLPHSSPAPVADPLSVAAPSPIASPAPAATHFPLNFGKYNL